MSFLGELLKDLKEIKNHNRVDSTRTKFYNYEL